VRMQIYGASFNIHLNFVSESFDMSKTGLVHDEPWIVVPQNQLGFHMSGLHLLCLLMHYRLLKIFCIYCVYGCCCELYLHFYMILLLNFAEKSELYPKVALYIYNRDSSLRFICPILCIVSFVLKS
jgi:hypothetical protein